MSVSTTEPSAPPRESAQHPSGAHQPPCIHPEPACIRGEGYRRPLFVLAVLVACFTFPLIFVGGSVTSNAAGMAFPDWPLSNGSVMPEGWTTRRDQFVEHGHRLLGAAVGLLVIALAVWTQAVDHRPRVRRFGWFMLAGVCLQGVLGGLRVKLNSTLLAGVHGVTAPLFFSMTLLMAVMLSRAWLAARPATAVHAHGYRKLALQTVGAVVLQIALGACLRHTGSGLAWHVMGALLAACLIGTLCLWTLGSFQAQPALARAARVLAWLLGIQFMLGIWAWLIVRKLATREGAAFADWAVPTAHVAVGALTLALTAVIAAMAYRMVIPAADRAANPLGQEPSLAS